MNILSLFDGISGARVALERLGINCKFCYFASEIDKYAIKISRSHYPDIFQLGNISAVETSALPKIDLLIGGSPCQGFSFAGKQLNFNDPRSMLFFEYVRILKECKPQYFLLENVRMKKEYQNVISKLLEVDPIMINSALVSAQNRVRLYWTNIKKITQPQDKGIILKDILEDRANKCGAFRGRYLINGKRQDYKMSVAGLTTQRLEIRDDNKSNNLSTVQKDNIILSNKAMEYMNRKTFNGKDHWSHASNIIDNKSHTVVANFCKGVSYNVLKQENLARYFTPIECERLQTYPDNYTKGVSNTQRYKMLGNSFTVDIIKHILSFI